MALTALHAQCQHELSHWPEPHTGNNREEITCSTIGIGNDEVNVKLEGNGCLVGEDGLRHICWLFPQGYAAAGATKRKQKKNPVCIQSP